jgi:RNA polymerase sigma-70 factor (ECF subfamily)
MGRNWIQFWKLLEPEHLKARAFCRKLMANRDDGDDLYQDSLVKALAGFSGLREESAFLPWLYRIVINTFKKRCRGRWWKRTTPLTSEIAETISGEDPFTVQAARRRLEIAFGVLSPDDRALVTLFELEGWKISELSKLTGKSESNVKVRLFRSREKMRDALSRYLRESPQKELKRLIRSEGEICIVTKPEKE